MRLAYLFMLVSVIGVPSVAVAQHQHSIPVVGVVKDCPNGFCSRVVNTVRTVPRAVANFIAPPIWTDGSVPWTVPVPSQVPMVMPAPQTTSPPTPVKTTGSVPCCSEKAGPLFPRVHAFFGSFGKKPVCSK